MRRSDLEVRERPLGSSASWEEPLEPLAQQVSSPWKEKLFQLWDSMRMTVYILGGSVFVFAAARNTITWHLQRVWGASGSYWQSNWEYVYDSVDGDHVKLGLWGTMIIANSAFLLANLLFLILDTTGHPKALLKYKIQEDKNVPVDTGRLLTAIKWVIFNQTVIAIPFFYIMLQVMLWRGCDFGRDLPTFHWVLFELLIYGLVEEFFFYYGHRLFHHPRLYKHFHKMHHEWTAPIGITAIYAHSLEHIICNLFPPIMGPVVMGSHLATAWLWFSIALVSTTISHCGYHFPLVPSPEAHDFHHLKFNQCYGVLGVLDRLHGTDQLFRRTKNFQRHTMYISLMPMKQQIPDDPKTKADISDDEMSNN